MKFRYSARTKTGEMQVGFVEAQNRETAVGILSSHELFVLSADAVKAAGGNDLLAFLKKVRRKDLMVFTRQLATMLSAKIPINDSLKALYNQTRNQFLKETIFEISTDIDAGLSLSQSLEKQSHIFSDFYINLIQAAEVTGRVEESMGFLADHLEKEALLISKVRNAMIYPIFVIVLFFVAGGIMLGVVFPKIAPIFEEGKVDLPVFTRFFLSAGTFINNWWGAILVVIGGLTALGINYFRSVEGRAVLDEIGLNTPLISNLFKKVYVARFSETVAVLIRGGIPLAQAMEISSHTVGSALYQEVLHDAAESIRRGELLSQALNRNDKFFPPIVNQMVALGEQTGKLEEMFGRISTFYTREVDDLVSNLVELIQPALMVVIGVMVGLLFASVLVPLYSLVGKIN